ERARRLLGRRRNVVERRSGPGAPELRAQDQGTRVLVLLQRRALAHGRAEDAQGVVLGREHAARLDVERDDDRDRQRPETSSVVWPPLYSGDADLSRVWTVVDELPADTRATIVMKSTVPVGTGEKVRAALDARGLASVGYVSNPEFTAEGTAVGDFMQPDRIVIGPFDEADRDAG